MLSPSKGIMKLQMPLPGGQMLHFYAEINADDIPLLIGLDVMPWHGLIIDFHSDIMRRGQYLWIVPLRYHRGHAFLFLPKTN